MKTMEGNQTSGVFQLSREQYDDIPRLNWSALKHMGKSPAHYRQYLLTGREDTDALKRGRVAHLTTFEPERFMRDCVLWDGGRRSGKEWEAFRRKYADKEILTQDEHDQCLAIGAAVRANAMAAKYLSNGRAEISLMWDMEGVLCKGRVDFEATAGALVDLKTTRDASPVSFGRQAHTYGHYAQAAFYSDGYFAATGKRLPYVLVAVETAAPFATQVYRVPEAYLEMGRDIYRPLVERLKWCTAANLWPAYAEAELELELPRWALPNDDEDFTSMDLVVQQ